MLKRYKVLDKWSVLGHIYAHDIERAYDIAIKVHSKPGRYIKVVEDNE